MATLPRNKCLSHLSQWTVAQEPHAERLLSDPKAQTMVFLGIGGVINSTIPPRVCQPCS